MTIYDGRESFYQWDLNQKITSDNFKVGDIIHFSNMLTPIALTVKAYKLDGKVVADVPNILLQTTYSIKAFRYISTPTSAQTVEERTFIVNQKSQPSDYFYTETELYALRNEVEETIEEAHTAFNGLESAMNDAHEALELANDVVEDGRTLANSVVEAEQNRAIAENTRVKNENLRATNETRRVDAENLRNNNELYRNDAEQLRIYNENLRQANFESLPNNIGNALKGVASGEVVRVDDVSSIEHIVRAKVSGENIDPTTVTVTRCGTNILPYPYADTTLTRYGIAFIDNGDGSITAKGTATSVSYFGLSTKLNLGEKAITPQANGLGYKISENLYYNPSNGVTSLNFSKGEVVDKTFYPMVVVGDTLSEYEPYNGTTYTPSTDGTVEIASLSPTMTLFTDTEGVTIDLEYNKDSNKAFANLLSRMTEIEELLKRYNTEVIE